MHYICLLRSGLLEVAFKVIYRNVLDAYDFTPVFLNDSTNIQFSSYFSATHLQQIKSIQFNVQRDNNSSFHTPHQFI